MTTQFSDFLAAHAARVAELSAPELTGAVTSSPSGGDPVQAARQVINAVLVALTADDLRPLTTFYELERPTGVSERLGACIADVLAIRQTALGVAAGLTLPPEEHIGLAAAAGEEVGGLLRVLAIACTGTIERQLTSAATQSSARGTSLSITMHELRRPLTILSSYGQLLSTGMLGALPETAHVAVEGIAASTEMMMRMVSSLAELARLEDPDDRLSVEIVTAEDVVTAAVEPATPESRLRGTSLHADVEPGITLRADKRRLALALTNLIGNAVKHGPADSAVEVIVRRVAAGAEFAVRDHGEGFPPEDAPHLFDKYFRSVAERKRKVPGSGLGLYIVRSVAEKHGGTASARTIPGNGAEFAMIIPIHGEER